MTPSQVSNNPRLVKEADALVDAGHDVRVVSMSARPDVDARDRLLMATRRWSLCTVEGGPRTGGAARLKWLSSAVRQRVASRAFDLGMRSAQVRDLAASRFLGEQIDAVCAQRPDVVVGHNLAALPVAVRAARRLGARVGFDVEDLHVEVMPDDAAHRGERALVAAVEAAYLPSCDFVTASSEGIADEVARRYGVRRPTVVHNVFPTEAARGAGLESARDGSPGLSLYWYSQVIGAGRGLEDAVIALSMLPEPASLHLRGESDPQFVPRLLALAAERGVRERVHLLPPAPADELVALAAQHDVGLALEIPDTLNRALCVTNKLFTYLAAGVAVAATDTPGQRRIIEQCDDAGFLYPPGDAAALAAGIARWAESRERLAAAREDARRSALERFSWERERLALLAAVVGDSSRVAAIA